MNGVGFFGQFSSDSCDHFYLVAPLFKVLQAISSQLVLSHRTYTISQKSAWVAVILALMVLVSVPALLFANIFKRQYVMTPEHNCTSGNDSGTRVAWIHYAICMVFDVATSAIASMYLWRYTREFKRLRVYLRRLLYEGLGYFILLTAVNTLNIVLFQGASVDNQSSGVSIGYIATWIMSQRVLIRQQGSVSVSVEDDLPSLDLISARLDHEKPPIETRSLVFAVSSRSSANSCHTATTTKRTSDDLWMSLPLSQERVREPMQVYIRRRSETVA